MNKNDEKWRKKRAQRGTFYHPRRAQKLIFHIRTVKRNPNEIEAQKKTDFKPPTTKKKKWKNNERKWKTNERKWKKMRSV